MRSERAYDGDHVSRRAQAEVDLSLEDVGCPMGCPPTDRVVFSGRDRYHGIPGEFDVVRCGTCGLMRTNPRPTPESMGLFYPDDYRMYSPPQRPVRMQSVSRLRRLARQLIHFNADDLPLEPPGSLLEVGCATGSYLAMQESRGWDVEGVEFSDSAARVARDAGFKVQTGAIEAVPPPDKTFDLVVMRMVLEHLHDPIGGLSRLRDWTRKGGWLMASIPNAGSYEWKLFGPAWYALELPRHLYHFTSTTVAALLSKAGWKLRKVLHQRNLTNVVTSVGHVMADRRLLPGLAQSLEAFPKTQSWERFALYPLAAGLSAVGQGGRITIWAERE